MTSQHPGPPYSRRVALARLGFAGLGATLGASTRPVSAAASSHDAHPMIGHWLATTPLGPAHVVFDREGSVLMAWPHSDDVSPDGFSYTTSATGSWHPVSARGIHFAVVQLESAPGGAVTGTTSLESIVVASADGASFRCGGMAEPVRAWASVAMSRMLVQDAAVGPELSGIRMWAEAG